MIVLGLLMIIISIILMVLVFGMTFGTFFLAFLGLAVLVFGILRRLRRIKKHKRTAALAHKILSALFSLWLVSFVIICGLILFCSPDKDVEADYGIILGAGIHGEEPSATLEGRLLEGVEYLEDKPDAKVVVSGGKGPSQPITEAEVMKNYLVEQGIDSVRIIEENRASNTKENIVYSQEKIQEIENDTEQKVVIITSDYHLFRAKMIANRYELAPEGKVAESPPFVLINYLVREYFAVIKSFLFD